MENVVAERDGARLTLRCRELRGTRTLSEMADIVGVRQDELGKIERGETSGMRFDTMLRLCAAYGVSPGELLTIDYDDSRPSVLEDMLAAVVKGNRKTHTPPRKRRRLRDEDLFMNLEEASTILDHELPTKRARKKAPTTVGRT
jgi:DNA-binding Xre family transcriptional regulator